MIIATRFRDLPDDQMKEIDDYVNSGRPVIGLRTATHAFNVKGAKPTPATPGTARSGLGGRLRPTGSRRDLDQTTTASHGKQSTRGIIAPGAADHPILRGIKSGDDLGPDRRLRRPPPAAGRQQPLVLGEVVADMTPTGHRSKASKNDPMMPVAWVKTYTGSSGKPARVFTTTMGAATDLENAGVRRLLVNAAYWATGLEDQIKPEADVDLVGAYKPRPFGFGGAASGGPARVPAGLSAARGAYNSRSLPVTRAICPDQQRGASWTQRSAARTRPPTRGSTSSPASSTHIDDGAIAAVTQVYRETLPPGGAVLDLMSSWVSHLPPEVDVRPGRRPGDERRGAGRQPAAGSFVVHDLNRDPTLPFAAASSMRQRSASRSTI